MILTLEQEVDVERKKRVRMAKRVIGLYKKVGSKNRFERGILDAKERFRISWKR